MQDQSTQPDTIWLKAAAVGGLWAAVEIVAGSYVHNLRLPFAGTLMTSLAICLLVASQQVWREKGILWRAGLICALMKSISPSAVILGPMLGIGLQGALMELGVRLGGCNIAGYLLGALLAVTGSMLQKIIRLLIIYGFDLVRIAGNLCHFMARQARLQDMNGVHLLLTVAGVYVLLAVLAVTAGHIAGNRARSRPGDRDAASDSVPLQGLAGPLDLGPVEGPFSTVLLALHLVAAAASLSLLHGTRAGPALLFTSLYVVSCVRHYKTSLRLLRRPALWLQVLIVSCLAAVFWNGLHRGHVMDGEGLRVGLTMGLRATCLLTAFSGISVELRNPSVMHSFFMRCSPQLYLSAGLAFSALPSIVAGLSGPRAFAVNPMAALARHVARAEDLLRTFTSARRIGRACFIITGERGQGKTTFAGAVAAELRTRGLEVAGILSMRRDIDKDGTGYRLVDLQRGDSRELCRTNPPPEWERQGRHGFNPEGLQFGRQILEQLPDRHAHVAIIDEVGPLELRGLGWRNALDHLLEGTIMPIVLVVRTALLSRVLDALRAESRGTFNVARTTPAQAADDIARAVRAMQA